MAQAPQASDVPYRGRFAPSPTGPLHAGSLLAAFGSWLLARAAGGQWLVRIEDVDRPREVPGAAEAQLATLSAFGLESDLPVVRQSERQGLYQAALQRLLDAGLAFPCSCSRSELAAAGGIHRRCVAAAPRPQPAIRLRVPDGSHVAFEDGLQGRFEQQVDREVGDFVLLRADGYWAYQLAVVVDDAAQGVTDVVRGADLLDSTPRQILLQRALGLPVPRYLHLPLLLDADGHKLSKSSAALPVDPADPLPALRHCWTLLGQDPAPLRGEKRLDALLWRAISHFDRARLPARLHFHQPLTTTSPDMSE
ncbi:tRNA glutamyl-Q(34) synthetase GluQRS [Pseudoxanthomonas suwonensis]|uniref:tRNA glutamyl-Q(34) synthetase GluQRS n=1 Tax=Pseudoxanthomonas suwonensis TaxID=314722 RepID=UPI00138F1C46|nr:tRNA glutamyl-Q(34) synthetase GluQRS [Pseudoxanthomonas suwonensis]KAF1700252.1 tRNA glutamyl-Q(34) synthetase GluQRS [Pseudoxanthomonas suwonensis]